jgi:peptidoglycan/xylan/chitin deacetylase (PgdA/CDA1 family)
MPLEPGAARPLHGMSVDVEEWFQVGAFERTIDKADWDRLDSRVEANTDAVSSLFAETGTRATFFTLGWVAHRHPGLIRRIVAAGHEMASHGWDHQRVFTMTADQFRADLLRARTAIEDAGGQAVTGYRAPSFSIDTRTPGRIPCWPRRAIVIPPARRAAAARPLWLGGLAALCLAAASRCRSDRAAGDGGAFGQRRLATGGGFFRMLPAADRHRDRAGRARPARRDVLFPPLGDRSRPAARHRRPARSRIRHYSRLARWRQAARAARAA